MTNNPLHLSDRARDAAEIWASGQGFGPDVGWALAEEPVSGEERATMFEDMAAGRPKAEVKIIMPENWQ